MGGESNGSFAKLISMARYDTKNYRLHEWLAIIEVGGKERSEIRIIGGRVSFKF